MLLACSLAAVFTARGQAVPDKALAPPPFGDTAGTVFDIIRVSDSSTFACLLDNGRGLRQIWDKRVEGEPTVNAFLYQSHFSDGSVIEIAINPEFQTPDLARDEALRYTDALGRLPNVLRQGVKRLSIHKGTEGFHAGTGQIVGYAGKTDQRLTYAHLEETLFHESVHASWDAQHRLASGWKNAQASDGRFLTQYGQKSPEREDLAETALFAFAILHYPGRLPPKDTQDTIETVPARMAYIRALLPPGNPSNYPPMDNVSACLR